MNLMDTAQLMGNFGEFFGAIAVVATLAYLAVQIKQNTKVARSTVRQSITDSLTEAKKMGLNPDDPGVGPGRCGRSHGGGPGECEVG